MLASVCDKLTGAITLQLDQCAQIVGGCHTNCDGHFHDHCSQCEQILDKKAAKIEAWLVGRMSQVYGLLSSYGVTLPTPEQLEAHAAGSPRPWPPEQLATGDASGEPAGEYAILPPGYSVPDSIVPYNPAMPTQAPGVAYKPGCPEIDICVGGNAWNAIIAAWGALKPGTPPDQLPDQSQDSPLIDPTYPIDTSR